MERKSERLAREAVKAYREGDLRTCLHILVDYADRRVRNKRTAVIFKNAIDEELSDFLAEVSSPDVEAPRCVHCGSYSTYIRGSDGDVGCNNCPGIMRRKRA